jgi:hypothetical protein
VFWRLGVYLSSTFACGYLAVINRVATACSYSSDKLQGANLVKQNKVRKITSLKTSPEVGKITSLNPSPKETNFVKKNCELGKITSMKKRQVPRKLTL